MILSRAIRRPLHMMPTLRRSLATAAVDAGPSRGRATASRLGAASKAGTARKLFSNDKKAGPMYWGAALGLAGLVGGQSLFGETDTVFSHNFITEKSPEDLADFYGTEDFMEIFCVFPFVIKLMMRNASFDDDGTIHAFGLLGPKNLQVNIDFDEKEEDTTGDGETDTITWFNKQERFEESWGNWNLWKMTQHFGFRRLEDGTCLIHHQGKDFSGFFLMRLVFQLHARYVIWATERFVNGSNFGSIDVEDNLERAELVRQNIPKHVFEEFLASLTTRVVQARDASPKGGAEEAAWNRTLQRLQTISADGRESEKKDHKLSRLHTMQTRRNTIRVQLEVTDDETRNTIQDAMDQLAEQHPHEPLHEFNKLARRTTLARRITIMKSRGSENGGSDGGEE